MKHNDLVQEVIRQSAGKFQPNISNIKKAIEGLIEKEYLKRNTEMNEVYEYIVWNCSQLQKSVKYWVSIITAILLWDSLKFCYSR